MPCLECMIRSEIQTPSKKAQKFRLVRGPEAPFDANFFVISESPYDFALNAPAHLGMQVALLAATGFL